MITIGLVNAGVLSFGNSVGIIFGANLGLRSDALLMGRDLSSPTLTLLDEVNKALVAAKTIDVEQRDQLLRSTLSETTRSVLPLIAQSDRQDAGAVSNFSPIPAGGMTS